MSVAPRQLRHAQALARHKSYRLAAEALGITQPALTKSIQGLEAQLGVRLFDRLPRSVEPTAFGEALVAGAAPVLAGIEHLTERLHRMRGLEAGTVAFGAGPALAAGSLGVALGEFVRRHPALRVRMLVRDWRALVEALRRLEIDFFAADVTALAGEGELEILETLDHHGIWFCRPEHPLARARKVGAEQIREFPVGSALLPPHVLAQVREFLGREGDTPGRPAWEPEIHVESFLPLERAVRTSDVVGIGTAYVHAEALRAGILRELRVADSPLRTRVGVVRLRGRSLSPGSEALVASVLAAVRRDLRRGP